VANETCKRSKSKGRGALAAANNQATVRPTIYRPRIRSIDLYRELKESAQRFLQEYFCPVDGPVGDEPKVDEQMYQALHLHMMEELRILKIRDDLLYVRQANLIVWNEFRILRNEILLDRLLRERFGNDYTDDDLDQIAMQYGLCILPPTP